MLKPECSKRRGLVAVLLVALAVRGGVLVGGWRHLQSDPDAYRALAQNVVRFGTLGGGEHPTAYRPPLYPLVIAPCVAWGDADVVGIGLLHLGLGLATVALTMRLARCWGLGAGQAAVAGLLVALDPILLRQSVQVMTETLATLLAVVALLALTAASQKPTWARWAVAGGVLGLASLCRPTFLPWLVACGMLLVWLGRREAVVSLARVLALVCGAAVVLMPWALRNAVCLGRPVVGTTHGGYTFYLANNDLFYDHVLRHGPYVPWSSALFDARWIARARGRDELDSNRLAYQDAWATVVRRPGMYAATTALRLARLAGVLPLRVNPAESQAARWARFGVAVWYLVEFALAAMGVMLLVRGRSSRIAGPTWAWAVLLILAFAAVHSQYWTNLRMRAPWMPVVALAAAAGVAGRQPIRQRGALTELERTL